jgi:hypothetical protein
MDERLIALIQKGTGFHLKEEFGIEPGAAPNDGSARPDDQPDSSGKGPDR